MVNSVAGMFEKQMRVLRRNNEMSFYIGFLDSMIEAAGTGVLTVDKEARVWKTNRKGKQILRRDDLEGKPVSTLKGLDIDLQDIYHNPDSWKTRECCITSDQEELQLLYSAQPVLSRQQELLGAVLVLEEFNDMYYRLNIVEIHIPPLRERGPNDIELLAHHFLKKYGAKCSLSDSALDALTAYSWPGNVRELENTIQKALHNCHGKSVQEKHLKLPKRTSQKVSATFGTLREMEREMISKTMSTTNLNIAKTARELGISRATLYRKLKEYGFQGA